MKVLNLLWQSLFHGVEIEMIDSGATVKKVIVQALLYKSVVSRSTRRLESKKHFDKYSARVYVRGLHVLVTRGYRE